MHDNPVVFTADLLIQSMVNVPRSLTNEFSSLVHRLPPSSELVICTALQIVFEFFKL